MKNLSFQLLLVFKKLPWKLEKCVDFMIWKQTSKFFRSFSKTKRSQNHSQKYETKLNDNSILQDFLRWFSNTVLITLDLLHDRLFTGDWHELRQLQEAAAAWKTRRVFSAEKGIGRFSPGRLPRGVTSEEAVLFSSGSNEASFRNYSYT